jgi:hypothetical protein
MLGIPFGMKDYTLTILKDVEEEVHQNPKLSFKFPWFDNQVFKDERLAKQVRLTAEEKKQLEAAKSVLLGHVASDMQVYLVNGRSPPSPTDCHVLAFGLVKPAIVVTDDLGMHHLAKEFGINIWHGYELLAKMRTAKMVDVDLVKEIYEAIENNGDLPVKWKEAKHTTFSKIFGRHP